MTAPVDRSAPSFSLSDTHGSSVSLVELTGRPVLLFFFPYAFTGVCTGELRDLAERHPGVTAGGVEVLAISTDTRFALRVFAEQQQLPFALLSDFWPHGATAQAYGCFDAQRGCAERATFLLDADHRIRWSARSDLGTARAAVAALAAVREL